MCENVKQAERLVAIVGRPNVGKSALFNRLVRRRLAIVHSEEGVTRDRLIAPAEWLGQRFRVVDTGGLALMDGARSGEDAFQAATAAQVHVAIEDAAAVILVVDLKSGLQPMDVEVSRLLHRSGRPVVVAVNKADVPDLDGRTEDFHGLGYPLVPVSAEHGRGMEALLEKVLPHLPAAPAEGDEPKGPALRVAVVGRPNVGKSSYINRLTRQRRVMVSNVPGTTRDSIEVPFVLKSEERGERPYVLVDTAGMRKSSHVRDSVEKFSLFRAERGIAEADLVVLVLDAAQGPGVQEKKIAALIREHHKACVVLINKWDLAKYTEVTAAAYDAEMRRQLFFLGDIPVLFVSAKSGYHIRQSFEVIDAVASRLEMRLPTGVLNRVLRDAFTQSQPPMNHGRQLKFYYATQTGTHPPRVTLFVNKPELNTPGHQAYLMGRLRAAFDLAGVPLVLRYRSSHEGGGGGSGGGGDADDGHGGHRRHSRKGKPDAESSMAAPFDEEATDSASDFAQPEG